MNSHPQMANIQQLWYFVYLQRKFVMRHNCMGDIREIETSHTKLLSLKIAFRFGLQRWIDEYYYFSQIETYEL